MKILFLKAYFQPEIAASMYLTENLIENLAANGFEAEIHVPTPTRGVSEEIRQEYKLKKYEVLYDGKIRIYRFAMFREGSHPFIRACRYLCCNMVQFIKGLSSRNVDLIYVTSTPPTMGALAAILKRFKKIPVVYSLQDIFPDSLISTGLAKQNSIYWKMGRLLESYTYKNLDRIIVISEDSKRNIMAKGVPEDKIEVVYNWVDENAVLPIHKDDNILFEKLNLSRDEFYVVYAGNLGHAQNIEIIINAAHQLIDHRGIKFVIFGGGQQEDHYKKMAQDLKLDNIQFFPLEPYSMVSQVYSLGDVSIVSCKEGFGGSAMPSKTWSIMSAGTAVLASFDEGTDMHRIIEENNVGIFTKAGDAEGLKEAILKLYNHQDVCQEMGQRGREFILHNLTREIGTKKTIEIMKSVVR